MNINAPATIICTLGDNLPSLEAAMSLHQSIQKILHLGLSSRILQEMDSWCNAERGQSLRALCDHHC
ncbi:hypothetical protein QN277_008628 [Acacia crassicarpa]|uniref:Uncharacterized protein n=1 Tax=Acacia crassicarpa TaxID=499986 RepID=A0AAE1M7I2_9FABA|nr:hypothetical protein QN277_008628 [Acacia crassicarpa]